MNAPREFRPGSADFQPTAVPRLGFCPVGVRPERVLLLASYDASEGGPQAITAAAWQDSSVFAVTVCNAAPGGRRGREGRGILYQHDARSVLAPLRGQLLLEFLTNVHGQARTRNPAGGRGFRVFRIQDVV